MPIPKSGVRTLLVVLYVAAVWIRLDHTKQSQYNYFRGESATNYRQAALILESGRLPATDTKLGWPDGFAAERERPTGIEYIAALSFRAVSFVSDLSLKEFLGVLTVVFFSLSVFTLYWLTFNLWACQAGSLFAAFLVAFSGPVVEATTASDFLHVPYAAVLVSLHLSLFVAYLRRPSLVTIVTAAVTSLVLFATWEGAAYYLVLFAAAAFVAAGTGGDSAKRRLFAVHLAAVVAAGLLLPHLRAARFLLSWPALCFMVITAYYAFRASLPQRVPGPVYILGGVVVASLLFGVLRLGGDQFASVHEFAWYRLRFLAGKPVDPQLLSDAVRFLWTRENTYPQAYTLLGLLLPLVFLVWPVTSALRGMKRETRSALRLSAAMALVGTALFLVDRSAVLAAALGLFPLAAAGFHSLGVHLKARGAPIAIAALIVVTQATAPYGKANATYQIGTRLGMSLESPGGFLWVSIGNADEDLVRHLVSRTSVRDVFLAPDRISSLLVSFAGRTTVLATRSVHTENISRTIDIASRFCESEETLYALCDSLGVKFVIYSIDMLLDQSKYSPRYLAGRKDVAEGTAAFDMHFMPEQLDHFNLVYENDNYRLFKVSSAMEPVFLTDHPLVYQRSIARRHHDSLDSFYDRIVDLLVTYHTAIHAQNRGDEEDAVRRFRYCLDQAPRFTKAWLGVGDSLLRMRDMEAANAAYMRVLQYAPDNSHALYYAALTLGHLERREEALGILEVLLSTGGERKLMALANELKAVLKSGIPLDGSTIQP